MTIYGIDISNHQDGLDLARVKAEGFAFVFCKVTEGDDFVDPTWPGFRDAAAAAGLLCAGYHYLRDDSDVGAQAQAFVQALGPGVPAMVDFEANGGDLDNFWAFVRAVNALGTQVQVSYIPHWYWQQIGSPDLTGVPGLIQSDYVAGSGYASALYPGDASDGWAAFGGSTPRILQFTDEALVAGMSLDADAFQGSVDQLSALLGIGQLSSNTTTLTQEEPVTAPAPTPNPDPIGDIREQLTGSRDVGYAGWPQLGQNENGSNRTLVDAAAAILALLTELVDRLPKGTA